MIGMKRTRKWLIEMLEEVRKANPTNAEHNGNCSDDISWLEKQEHTDNIIEMEKTEKQRVIITETDGNANIDWDTRSLEDTKRLLECGLQYINTELKKQGWHKHVDKIQQKFNKGDIIKTKDGVHEPYQIMQVDMFDKKYRFKNGCVIHFSQEYAYELIYKKPVDYENAIILQRDFAPKEEAEPKILGIGVEHARGVLKQCLDKNKEFKKIDNEIEIPFCAKDSELHEVTYFIPKGFHAEIDDDKVVIKKGEQKPTAWRDQDEENLQHSTAAIMAADYYTLEDKEELCKGVESVKERVQPQTKQLKTENYERLKRISQFVWNELQRLKRSLSSRGELNAMFGKNHTEETKRKMSKPILQYNLNGDFVAEYYGAEHAHEITGIHRQTIVSVLKGRGKTAGGFVWKYKE